METAAEKRQVPHHVRRHCPMAARSPHLCHPSRKWTPMILSKLESAGRRSSPAKPRLARRERDRSILRMESLEGRDLLAILWVDNTPGSGGTEFTSSGGTQPASVGGLVPGTTIFPTINAAIAAAVSGADTINVANGSYPENVVVNKQL